MALSTPSTSVETYLQIPEGICAISYSLDVDQIIKSVQNDAAGATAVFIGTTRNSFQGKIVTRLEYQAYSKLAIKTMADVIRNATRSLVARLEHQPQSVPYTGSLVYCAVHHRIGDVPVGQPSIAVSSPHRKEAFLACEQILEEVKRKAQIWKREYYEGESDEAAEWKANY